MSNAPHSVEKGHRRRQREDFLITAAQNTREGEDGRGEGEKFKMLLNFAAVASRLSLPMAYGLDRSEILTRP